MVFQTGESESFTLAEVKPGQQALVIGFNGLSTARREHLQAYGLSPGCHVRVLQQTPVTVIQIDHTELAFEAEIARGVKVAVDGPDAFAGQKNGK